MDADDDLITQVLIRTGSIGVVVAALTWWYFGWEVGAGIAVGAALAILNTMALRFVLDRLIPESEEAEDDVEEEESSSAIWATGLFFKMTLLLGAAYLAMAWFGVHPMGLVVGYSLLLPGLIWAWVEYLRDKNNTEDIH